MCIFSFHPSFSGLRCNIWGGLSPPSPIGNSAYEYMCEHRVCSRQIELPMSTIKVTQIYPRSVDLYTVSQNKRHPVYSCGNFVRCHLISLIFVRSITGRIRNEKAYLQPTTWFNKSELNLVILARPSHHRTALATPWLSDPRGTVDLWHRTVQA